MTGITFRPLEMRDSRLLQRLLEQDDFGCWPTYQPFLPSETNLQRNWLGGGPQDPGYLLLALEGDQAAAVFSIHSVDWVNRRLFFCVLFAGANSARAVSVVRAFRDYVIARAPVRQLTCPCLPDSETQRALAEAGFEERVRRRGHAYVAGRFTDVLLMVHQVEGGAESACV